MENGNESPSPMNAESLLERLKTPKAIGMIMLVAFLLLSRLWDPSIKAVQHDESMFGYYSWIIFEKTEKADFNIFSVEKLKGALAAYQYMPIMHGPFLEFVTAGIFYIFGDSDTTMRLGCIFSGLLIFLSLYLLRKDIGEGRALLAIFLIGLCPTLTFVTRYLRPDMYVIFMYIAAIHAGWRYAQTLRPWRLAVFLLVGWTASMTHETYFIFYFFMITFGIGCWIHGVVHPEKYADEDFSPKGGGWFPIPTIAKYVIIAPPILFLLWWLGGIITNEAGENRRALTIMAGIAALVSGEVIAFVIKKLQASGAITEIAFLGRALPNKAVPFYREVRYALTYHWPVILISCLVGLFITVAFHTSFFNYMHHKWGQIEAFQFWQKEHEGHRIKGEFHFHLLLLLIYEMPLLVLFVIACVKQMWAVEPSPFRYLRRALFIAWLIISVIILNLPATWTDVIGDSLWNAKLDPKWDEAIHMTRGFHIWMFIQCLIVVFITGWIHLNKKRVFHALCDYWFIGSFLAYSYAGEKVPWVLAHIVLPMMISCALYIWMIYEKYFVNAPSAKAVRAESPEGKLVAAKKSKDPKARRGKDEPVSSGGSFWSILLGLEKIVGKAWRLIFSRHCLTAIALVSVAWTAYVWTLLVFVQPGSPIERHTYASSHTEFHAAIREVIAQCEENYSGMDTPIIFGGEPGFPLNWYLRDFKSKHQFSGTGINPNGPKLMLPVQNPPGTMAEPVFVIMDNVMFEKSVPGPLFKDRYAWLPPVRFRHYWQPIPLKWDKMKKIGLLFRSEASLTNDPVKLMDKQTFVKEWQKFLIGYIVRDEELSREGGTYEWLYLGGFNVYFGRLRADLPAQ